MRTPLAHPCHSLAALHLNHCPAAHWLQGFPDYHVLLARPSDSSRPKPRFIRSAFYTQRYQVCCAVVVKGLQVLRLAT